MSAPSTSFQIRYIVLRKKEVITSLTVFASVIYKHHILFMSYSGWSTNDGSLISAMARKSGVLGSNVTGIT